MAQLRLKAALALLVVWLAVADMRDLAVAEAAVVSSVVPVLLVAAAALQHPGARRNLPRVAYAFPFLAALAVPYVFGVEDFAHALAIRVQWFAMTVAALLVMRTIADRRALAYTLDGLVWGLAAVVVVAASSLVVEPGQELSGHLRFEPYGGQANTFGTSLALAGPLCLYAALRTRPGLRQFVLVAAGAAALGMVVLTASRAAMVVTFVPIMPLALHAARSGRRTASLVATGTLIAGVVIVTVPGVDLDRVDRAWQQDTRVRVASAYTDEIGQRPMTGLMFTDGLTADRSQAIGTHTHNAYLDWFYLGGISLGVPWMLLAMYTGWRALALLRARHRVGFDSVLAHVLALMLLVMLAQGFATRTLYYPTYSWAFMHVLLAQIAFTSHLRSTPPRSLMPTNTRDYR